MAGKLPKDCTSRAICTRSRGIFAYKLDATKWEWHEQTGSDHGTDVVLELSDDNQFAGKKVEGQLKGTQSVDRLKNGTIYFDLDVKTVNYALGNANPFVLFVIDTEKETVFFLPIQDYFISKPSLFDAALENTSTVRLHIDPCNNLDENADKLIEIARSVYVGGPSKDLKKIVD